MATYLDEALLIRAEDEELEGDALSDDDALGDDLGIDDDDDLNDIDDDDE